MGLSFCISKELLGDSADSLRVVLLSAYIKGHRNSVCLGNGSQTCLLKIYMPGLHSTESIGVGR